MVLYYISKHFKQFSFESIINLLICGQVVLKEESWNILSGTSMILSILLNISYVQKLYENALCMSALCIFYENANHSHRNLKSRFKLNKKKSIEKINDTNIIITKLFYTTTWVKFVTEQHYVSIFFTRLWCANLCSVTQTTKWVKFVTDALLICF